MRSMQRRFGKILPRSEGDTQVSQLLQNFLRADECLTELIESTKALQQAWKDILGTQQRLAGQFRLLFEPITSGQPECVKDSFIEAHPDIPPRAAELQRIYSELEVDLEDEIQSIETRIVTPSTQVKDSLHQMRKNIKRRDDYKVDFERYQGRRDTMFKKTNRSQREDAALAKHETDLLRAKQDYERADGQLKSHLPQVLAAIYSVMPSLLVATISVSNDLPAHLYTQLHEFCIAQGFPSPPPTMAEVISKFTEIHRPLQQNFETRLAGLNGTKINGQPLKQAGSQRTVRPLVREIGPPARLSTSEAISPGEVSMSAGDRLDTSMNPLEDSSGYEMPNHKSPSPSPCDGGFEKQLALGGPNTDYFVQNRVIAKSPSIDMPTQGKKKPPPPPPKKVPGYQDLWVTALYDFAGQAHGDLKIKEGDRIRVTKKTNSINDWWEGELDGVAGSFPANYCQA